VKSSVHGRLRALGQIYVQAARRREREVAKFAAEPARQAAHKDAAWVMAGSVAGHAACTGLAGASLQPHVCCAYDSVMKARCCMCICAM
jgi:hypothetical protein